MSEKSVTYQSDGSIAAKELSPSESNNILTSEIVNENENGKVFDFNKHIGIEVLKEQTNIKDNFKLNFLNFKSEKKSCLNNDCKFVSCKEDQVSQNDHKTDFHGSENIRDDNVNYNNLVEESSDTIKAKSINCMKTGNGNINNSETGEVVMKAAFSRVAEHFGLSSPDGILDTGQTYYGVYIPSDSNINSSDEGKGFMNIFFDMLIIYLFLI